MKIFKKFHGSIIGRGGATLKKIREETSTKIDMPKEGSESDVIVITGRKENVEKAKRQLQDIEKQMVLAIITIIYLFINLFIYRRWLLILLLRSPTNNTTLSLDLVGS